MRTFNNYAFGPFQPDLQRKTDAVCVGANSFWDTIVHNVGGDGSGSDSPLLPAIRDELDACVARSLAAIATSTTGATRTGGAH